LRIALISCTKNKKTYPCKAVEMYEPSTLFKKAKAFVEKQGYDDWFILSAKHGLLSKDTIIDPYDVTLINMKAADRKAWTHKVFEQLTKISPSHIDFYAGQKYRQYLIPMLEEKNVVCHVPLLGLEIGEQLQFYTKALQKEKESSL
jgi:hypothetical protein